jgi:hypothetical protein
VNSDNIFQNISDNVIIYCYAKNGDSLKEQQKYIRITCLIDNKKITKIYSDACVSNTLNDKSNLNKLLQENSNVDVVISSIDRLTRKNEDMKLLKEICKKNKIRFYSIKENKIIFDNKVNDAIEKFLKILKDGDCMGYRSDVRILTTKKGYKELKNFTENYTKEKNCYNLLNNPEIFNKNNTCCYIGWNYLKWYEDYSEVDAIIKGLDYLKEKDISYRLAVCGEDYSDYQEDIYNSKRENFVDLDYPSLIREFDDEYIIDNMNHEISKSKENDL